MRVVVDQLKSLIAECDKTRSRLTRALAAFDEPVAAEVKRRKYTRRRAQKAAGGPLTGRKAEIMAVANQLTLERGGFCHSELCDAMPNTPRGTVSGYMPVLRKDGYLVETEKGYASQSVLASMHAPSSAPVSEPV